MNATLKTLSLLLCYPSAEVRAELPELGRAVRREGMLKDPVLGRLLSFMEDCARRDLYDLQERYVLLFDRTRSLSLHLFEHVHGESRERGRALVDLAQLYRRHGLMVDASELPDYLPMFLEFAATLPAAEVRGMLAEILHIVTALEERLRRRNSAYADVLKAVEACGRGAAASDLDLHELPDDDPDDLEALDRAWEEAPVTFGPGSAGIGGTPGSGCAAARKRRP